jgi:conjugal transfer pilus assembly protein TraB
MSNINTATRRRQWMIAGISAAVMLATGGGIWAWSHHQAELNRPAPKAAPNLTGSLVNTSFTEGVATSALQQQQNKTAGLEKDMNTLAATLKTQNDDLRNQLAKMGEVLSQLQKQQTEGGKTPTGPGQGTAVPPGAPANGPVPGGPSGPAQWSVTPQSGAPAAGRAVIFIRRVRGRGRAFIPAPVRCVPED